MRLGIFAKTFARPTLTETFDAAVSSGFDCIQFNYACAGLPSLPEAIPAGLAGQIGEEARRRNLVIAAVSGTFNLIDPDRARREEGFRRLELIAASCAALGTSVVTLCTGTRDATDMWRHHPHNELPEAWDDLLAGIDRALEIAGRHNVILGIEPETGNVVSSARKARQLLNERASPHLKIVIDPSNLFHPGETAQAEAILDEAFDLLGRDLILAHAKDFRETEGRIEHVTAGRGVVPWAHYFRLLRTANYRGPLLMHGLAESEATAAVDFLKTEMMRVERLARLAISGTLEHDGIQFHYQQSGRGIPFIFQHGLGGQIVKMFALFNPPAGFRMVALDCRMHGLTQPPGPEEKIGIASFADDLLALLDYLKIDQAIIGGTSMGAAVALNFALRHPERVCGLVLQRPAWLDQPRHENVAVYTTMAKLLRAHGAERGLEEFVKTPLYDEIRRESEATAKSLAAHFTDPKAAQAVALIERIPVDSPGFPRAAWKKIAVPTLVLANKEDLIHPIEYGRTLAAGIPGAEFCELTPKARNPDQHNAEIQRAIETFLLKHF